MGVLVSVRPDNVIHEDDGTHITMRTAPTEGGDHAAVLADNDDSTCVIASPAENSYDYPVLWMVGLNDFGQIIPAGARVEWVAFQVRGAFTLFRAQNIGVQGYTRVGLTETLEWSENINPSIAGVISHDGIFRTVMGSRQYTQPTTGDDWTFNTGGTGTLDILAFAMQFSDTLFTAGDSGYTAVSAIFATASYRRQGSVIITGPAPGEELGSGAVTIAWEPIAPDNPDNPQAKYEVSVWDPTHTTLVYSSSPVTSTSARSHVTSTLSPGEYSVAVRVAQPWSGTDTSDWWSDVVWMDTFFVAANDLSTPSVVATADPANARVKLDITGSFPTISNKEYIIERSTDGGTTWTHVHAPLVEGAGKFSYVAATTTVYDYEAPLSVNLVYRAYEHAGDSGVGFHRGSYSANSNTVNLVITEWFLKDREAPSRNMVIDVLPSFDTTTTEQMAIFKPLGRTFPVKVSDSVGGDDGSLKVMTIGLTAHGKLQTLKRVQTKLVLQSPFSQETWYVQWSGDRRNSLEGYDPSDAVRTWDLPYIEVSST